MVYNGYYKVMSNIPKMGQLPTPVHPWFHQASSLAASKGFDASEAPAFDASRSSCRRAPDLPGDGEKIHVEETVVYFQVSNSNSCG